VLLNLINFLFQTPIGIRYLRVDHSAVAMVFAPRAALRIMRWLHSLFSSIGCRNPLRPGGPLAGYPECSYARTKSNLL